MRFFEFNIVNFLVSVADIHCSASLAFSVYIQWFGNIRFNKHMRHLFCHHSNFKLQNKQKTSDLFVREREADMNKGSTALTYQINLLGGLNWPRGLKHFSWSTQQSMKFFLLINVKMPAVVGILTFMSGKNSILGLSEPKKRPAEFFLYFYIL